MPAGARAALSPVSQPHVAARAAEPAPVHAAARVEDGHAVASGEAGSAALVAAAIVAAGARAGVRGGAAPEHAHGDNTVTRADRDASAASAAALCTRADVGCQAVALRGTASPSANDEASAADAHAAAVPHTVGCQAVAVEGAASPSTAEGATAADAHAPAATRGAEGAAAARSSFGARAEAAAQTAPAAQPVAVTGGLCLVPAAPAALACPAGTAPGFGDGGRGAHAGLAAAASMAGGVAAGAMAAADRQAQAGAGASPHDVPSSARAEPGVPASSARSASNAAACGGQGPAAEAVAIVGLRSGACDSLAAAPVAAAGAWASATAACAAAAGVGARRASSVGTQCFMFSEAAAGNWHGAAVAEARAPLAKAASLPTQASVALIYPPMQPAPLVFRAAGAAHGAGQRCTRSGAPSAALARPVWAQRPRSASRAHAAAAAGDARGPRRLNSAPAGWVAAAAGAGRPSSAGAAWPAPGPRPRWPTSAPPPTSAERERWASPGGILEWVPWGMAPWQMEPVGWRPRSAAGGDHAGLVHAEAGQGDPTAEHAQPLLQQGRAAACPPAARGEAPALDRRFSGPHHAAERALRPARPPQGEGAAEEEAALRALCEELLRPRSAGPPRPAAPREPWRPTQPRALNLATASRARSRPEPARTRAGADGGGASPQREAPPALALSPSTATPRIARACPAHGGATGPEPSEGPARAASGVPESAGEQRRVQVGRTHGGQPLTVAPQPAREAHEAASGVHEAATRAAATPAACSPQVLSLLSRPAASYRHAGFGALRLGARRRGPLALASCAGMGSCTCNSIMLTLRVLYR